MILKAAGILDVWMQSFGQTKNKINLIKATEQALKKLSSTKLRPQDVEKQPVITRVLPELLVDQPQMLLDLGDRRRQRRARPRESG